MISVTVTQAQWEALLEKADIDYLPDAQVVYSAAEKQIREALKQRVKCPECKGAGYCVAAPSGVTGRGEKCQRCDGSGTVPNSIPGARLLERQSHLRVE